MKYVVLGFLLLGGCTEYTYEMQNFQCEEVCEPRRYKLIRERYIRAKAFKENIVTHNCFCRSDGGDWIHYKKFHKGR